ncbi:MAG: DsrE family protein [Pseudomonadota bacterium]|nr:DsrE family protein [Pseudomonadota bacterium]
MRSIRIDLPAFAMGLALVMLPLQAGFAGDLHKLAIHVDRDDAVTQRLAVNNATKAWELLQPDVAIEVVTYGPGIALVTEGGKQEQAVIDLMQNKGVKFHLCEVTVRKKTKKLGKKPDLIDGVNIVPSGTVKLMELQEDGFSYLKP